MNRGEKMAMTRTNAIRLAAAGQKRSTGVFAVDLWAGTASDAGPLGVSMPLSDRVMSA